MAPTIRSGTTTTPAAPDSLTDWTGLRRRRPTPARIITGIFVTTGFTGGVPLAAILRSLSVNGSEFVFGS